MTSLEDDDYKAFDQFAANSKMHGLKSEFDEHDYTTKIDYNNVSEELKQRAE